MTWIHPPSPQKKLSEKLFFLCHLYPDFCIYSIEIIYSKNHLQIELVFPCVFFQVNFFSSLAENSVNVFSWESSVIRSDRMITLVHKWFAYSSSSSSSISHYRSSIKIILYFIFRTEKKGKKQTNGNDIDDNNDMTWWLWLFRYVMMVSICCFVVHPYLNINWFPWMNCQILNFSLFLYHYWPLYDWIVSFVDSRYRFRPLIVVYIQNWAKSSSLLFWKFKMMMMIYGN